MAGSDIVGLFASLDAESRHMIDARRLALMKPSAFLVNVARGALIDESALIEVLAAHRIAGAALDAFETEPLPPDSPLRKLDNVILTPHQIGHTLEAEASLGPAAVENVVALLKGEVPPRLRNPQVLPLWEQKWRGRPV
jgi:D-3-phosphoglycerate dehydrogenase